MRVEFDFSALRGRIIELFGSCAEFCRATNKPRPWLSGRLNNKVGMTPEDILFFSEKLNIADEDTRRYFLTRKV